MENSFDSLVSAGASRALQLLLWKNRFDNPELSAQITAPDIKGLDDCADYLKITPDVRIWRPGGLPAIAATSKTPGRAFIPYKDYVMVQMVEKGTENSFKPVENNETDFDRSQAAAAVRALREQIPVLAAAVKSAVAGGTFSESEIIELCEAATKLARAGKL